jgi:hypothetical protein
VPRFNAASIRKSWHWKKNRLVNGGLASDPRDETDAGRLPLAVGLVLHLARYSTLGLYKTSLIYLPPVATMVDKKILLSQDLFFMEFDPSQWG